jgi:signal transduction histidine kinase
MLLRREPVRLSEVVERAAELYRDAADAKGIGISSGTVEDLIVVGDRVRLEQVAANLLDNAVKYTASGGRIVVNVMRKDKMALLQVRDSGAGIIAEEQPRIWERLYRGDRSRAERGLGLGLSLVKAVVEAHGGSVSVVSESGQGALFNVLLPLHE